jgi:DNA replication protein DnaC
MQKICKICKKIQQTKRLYGIDFPINEGHEECLIIERAQEEIKEKNKYEAEKQAHRQNLLFSGFAGASIDWRRRTWEQWVENDENKGVTELLKGLGYEAKGLVLSGAPGVGKTHLLVATAVQMVLDHGKEIKFIRFSTWADEMRSVNFEHAGEMLKTLQSSDALFIDDIGASSITEHIEDKFIRILDYRLEFNMQTYISTNLSQDEAAKAFSPRVFSRLTGLCEWINILNIKKDWRNK